MAVGRRGRNKKAGPKTKSKWKDRYIVEVGELIRSGLSMRKLAKFWGVTPETIYSWKRSNKSFSEQLVQAQDDVNVGKVEKSLLRRASGYKYSEITKEPDDEGLLKTVRSVRKTVPPDTGAITFHLKNRAPGRWKDKHEVEGGLTIISPDRVEKAIPDVI